MLKALTCDYKYKKVLITLSLKSNVLKLHELLNYFNSFTAARFRYLNFDIIFIKLIQGNMSVDEYNNKLKVLIMRVNKKFFGQNLDLINLFAYNSIIENTLYQNLPSVPAVIYTQLK